MKNYFVHERAICESTQIGEGTRIWGFSHVMSGAKIGSHCNLGEHVFVENKVTIGNGCTIKNGVAVWDHVTLEDDVFLGPYVVLTNDFHPRAFLKGTAVDYRPIHIGRGATVGANSTIVCGVTIGKYALIAAGTVVTRDVPDHGLVMGNPGKIVGKVCFCSYRLKDEFCPSCKKSLSENSQSAVLANPRVYEV